MSEETFHLTKEDIRKTESKTSEAHRGDIPAGSDAAGLQVSPVSLDARTEKCIANEL